MYTKSADPVIRQFIYETEAWARMLVFLRQETVYFKTRLAEIVTDSADVGMLTTAEKFQEEFLAQDQVIRYLAGELARQTRLLERDLYGDGDLMKEVSKNQKILRVDFKKEEELFAKVKDEFCGYLVEHF